MKIKTILLSALAVISLILPFDAQAQGTISFNNVINNGGSSLVRTNDGLGHIGVAQPEMVIRVQLYYGQVGSTEGQLVAFGTPIGLTGPGVFFGGTYTLPGIAAGGSAAFQVRGWTGNFATYEEASLFSFYSSSAVWTQTTGGVGTPPSLPPNLVNGPGGFNGLVLGVPEPSTYALFSLGLLGLVWKRKK